MPVPGLVWTGVRVLSGASLVGWVVSVATSQHHHPVNFWLVIFLGFLAATLLLWGLEQRSKARGQQTDAITVPASAQVHVHIIEGSQSSTGIGAPPVPSQAGTRTIVRLSELVNERDAVISGQAWEDADVLGPAVVVPLGTTVLDQCEWMGEPDAVLWEIPADRQEVIGGIALEDCVLRRCRMFNVGLAYTASMRDDVRRGFGLD
jgi:hypothetical protein